MTTIDEYEEALGQWCVDVARLYAEHAKPILSTSDPRVSELISASGGRLTEDRIRELINNPDVARAEELSRFHFSRSVPLPRLPIPAPAWAEDYYIDIESDWPHLEIEYTSKPIVSGDVSATVYKTVSVTASETADPGPVVDREDLLGMRFVLPSGIEIYMEDLKVDDLRHIREVLGGAADMLSAETSVFEVRHGEPAYH
jgi:hypothetical protein